MKKKTKNFLGILGLGIIALITGVAINLPSPDANATTSVVDTITVRVIDDNASINITSPAKDATFLEPNQKLAFDYANVDKITVTLYVTDANNIQHEYPIDILNNLDYQPGSKELSLDLSNYGYGEYVIEMVGTGYDALTTSSVSFRYVPLTASLEQKDDGSYWEHLAYDTSTVGSVKVEIFDESDTDFSNPLWIQEYSNGEKNIKLPFGDSESVKENKKYVIRLTPYSPAPEKTPLYKSIYQELETEDIIVPNTGSFFQGLNISRTDYLITGLIIFSSFAIFAIIFTVKQRKAYRNGYAKKGLIRKHSAKRLTKKYSSRKK